MADESNAIDPSVVKSSVEAPLMDHEYDGIKEYDNPLPAWWVNIFWATVVFSIGYFFHYQLTGQGQSAAAGYEAEQSEAREAEAKRAIGEKMSEESLAGLMQNTALMADARTLFVARCLQCHADRGQGGIGPNLTDGYWIHGQAKLMEIYAVVNEGVPAKGMPAWGRQLTPIELGKVVAYVGTLRNSNVPGKAPEGSKVAGLSDR
jgi:cytochrome c oxidase cbb3-type subunit III